MDKMDDTSPGNLESEEVSVARGFLPPRAEEVQVAPPSPPLHHWGPPQPPRIDVPGSSSTQSPITGSQKPRLGGKLGTLGLIGLVLLKFGAKFKLLLLLLPKLKLFTTSASMLVSVAAYSLIWGWKFALGFVLLLLVHEMGHVIQLRREGIEASAPLFIPFIGAVVGAKSLGGNALAEARVGLAGPVLGTLGTAALIPFAVAMDSDFLRALAFTGFFLNLFNLLPVLPLDGGRAMAALSPKLWLVGFGALVIVMFVFPSPVMILILLLGGLETWHRFKRRHEPEQQAFYKVAPRHRAAVAAVYIGLAVVLAIGMNMTFVERTLDSV